MQINNYNRNLKPSFQSLYVVKAKENPNKVDEIIDLSDRYSFFGDKISSSVEIPEDATTIIVNNGTEQTENIALVADANCVVVSGTSSVYAKYENGTVTVVEIDLGLPQFYVVGTISGWNFVDENKLVIDEATMTAAITVNLAEGDEFKIALSGWAGEVGSDALGAAFSVAEGGNITVVTAGTYRIVVSNLDSTPSLTITAVTE